MKIVTAANYRMRRFALSCVKSARKLGYSVIVYDLGGLGFGKPFKVEDVTFQKNGYYREITKGRCALANHKPVVIKDCLRSCNEFIIYLDADTVLMEKIDEMAGDYDIGLTVRPEWEVEKVVKNLYPTANFIYDSYVNAGVMCFNPTEAAYRFVEKWERETLRLGNDQGALNSMLQEYFPLKSGQVIEKERTRIRTFDTLIYNHYYFRWPKFYKRFYVTKEDIGVKWQKAKILHFKGNARLEYLRIFYPLAFYFTRPVTLDPLYRLSKKLKERFVGYRRFIAFIKGAR